MDPKQDAILKRQLAREDACFAGHSYAVNQTLADELAEVHADFAAASDEDVADQEPDYEHARAHFILALFGGLTVRSERRIRTTFRDPGRAEIFLAYARDIPSWNAPTLRDRLSGISGYVQMRLRLILE